MNDVLVELGKNPNARRLIGTLGLPIPLPESLRRERGPLPARPLADRAIAVAAPNGRLLPVIAETLTGAGADPWVLPATDAAAFRAPGETFGRPARPFAAFPERARLDGVIVDASGLVTVGDLRALFDALAPLVPRLGRSSRVVVLGRAAGDAGREEAAAQAALEGFVRSVAKEIGRVGATANLVRVAAGAELRVPGALRFVLSARSAFVTGQPIVVDAIAAPIDPERAPWVRSLEGKVALVTGAARGIGEATARRLADEGARVVCLDRPADDGPLSQLARAIGGSALAVDLSDDDAPAKVVAHLGGRGIDVVVHNAGITRDKTLARMKPELWDAVLGVNLGAVERLHAALLPALRDQGRVVCLSSIAGLAGNMGQTAYAASKAGIVGWVRAEAAALAPRGITVNAIAPGFIETRLTAAIPVAIREVARRLSALAQGGLPTDVAEAITFLATPSAQGLTGRTLRVCGGAFVGA